ncbi:two component LuxR family transcriptional regulator, partial [Cupriavidus basilensis OR16]
HAAYDKAYSMSSEASSSPARLNDREKDVLAYAALGLSSKEIGQELGISARTVDYYVDLARDKLGAHNRTEAIVRGILTRQICGLNLPGERKR